MIKRLLSFKYAFAGLADMVRTQVNARIHLAAATSVLIAGWFFQLSATEWALLFICIAGVLAAEAFNTALEYLTDLVSPGIHPLAGKAKDAAAAAVLLVSIGAIAVGLLIFLPKFFSFLNLE